MLQRAVRNAKQETKAESVQLPREQQYVLTASALNVAAFEVLHRLSAYHRCYPLRNAFAVKTPAVKYHRF